MNKINFHFHEISFTLRNRRALKHFLAGILKQEGRSFEIIDFIFCSDVYLLHINQKFLDHNYYTDIITFNLANNKMPVLGEIYISYDRVKQNAKELKLLTTNELHRVMIHGVLHLCGYLDKSHSDKIKMTRREDYYLSRLPHVSRETNATRR